MNKKDFEILSPTYKEKTEMKERLMREATKEEKKPVWLEISFYAKIAASLMLIVGVAVVIGLIVNSGGTGIDISTPPVSKPVINNSSSESEDLSSSKIEEQPSEKLNAKIYLCSDTNHTDDTQTHGSASINLSIAQYNLELKDYQVFLCEDNCEKSALVSRASQGNAPVYNVISDGEIDGNPKALRFRMTIPESMVESLKEQGNYESVTQRLDSNYYYLIELDEKHYAYIHLARKKDAEKTEDEVANADAIIKNAKIDLNSDTSSETESDLSSNTSSEEESIIESEPTDSDTESNDTSVDSEEEPDFISGPYVTDIGTFDTSGVLYEKPVIENEKIKIQVQDLYYGKYTVMLSYLVTNNGDEELDIGTYTAGMGNYPDVFVNGYSYLDVSTYSEYITTQLSKEKLSHGETSMVTIEIRYDFLLSVGITNVTELKTALYYGKRWSENEVDFEEYETACIEVKTSLYDEGEKPVINYEEQLKNETVQEKTGYTFLQFIDTPFDEQNGIVIENAALLKTKSDIDGKEHYTVRLTVHNVTDNTVDFRTAVHVINDIATVMVGAIHPGNDIFAGERLILDVNTMSIDDLANYGITDIREIRLCNDIITGNDEREQFYNEIVFSDEEDGAELSEELYNGNGVVITVGKIYEEYEHGNVTLLFDTAKSMKRFGFTGNACTINGKEFVIGNSSYEIQVGHLGGWDAPIEGSVKKPFVLFIPMEMYDEIGITSVSEIEEVTLKLTIYNDDGAIADEPVIKVKQ
ncbi:MAG: hypothetical protein E7490_07835 [Ruminococcaceae bacterium]|nr:hypothetical protein [Oscillospiraceae bacterium]